MGAQGIRRRKRCRDLPEPDALPPADADRMIGAPVVSGLVALISLSAHSIT